MNIFFRFLLLTCIICLGSSLSAQGLSDSFFYSNPIKGGDSYTIPNGFGYKILKYEDGFTFENQLTEPNTIYEIRYSYDLNNTSVTIPENCVLFFNGGVIKNGTLVGQNTRISADAVQIFDTDIAFSGSWFIDAFLVEWMGAKADNFTDNTEVLNKLFQTRFYNIKFGSGTYLVSGTIMLNSKNDIENKLLRIQGVNDYCIDNNGTIIKTTSKAPIFSIGKLTYQLRIHDIHFITTVSDGVGLDFEKSLSEFHLSHLKFTGSYSSAIKINGSIGTIEQCYFSEELSTTSQWKDVKENRYAIELNGYQITVNNCNFWRVRTGIKLGKAISCSLYNNWFESNLHNDVLFLAYTLSENVNIYNNTFLNTGYVNDIQYDSSAASIKFDGNSSSSIFFGRTINIYSNYCWNETNAKFIDFDWNSNKGGESSFSNIHIYNNDIDGNVSYLFYANEGATSVDVVFYGNRIKETTSMYNDQYGRKYRCVDSPKSGTTINRLKYKYWTQGDTYYDTDLGKLLVFVGHKGNMKWVDSSGASY